MDKIAVVTGAAGGMGRVIVARLIADGFQVIGLDVDAIGLADRDALVIYGHSPEQWPNLRKAPDWFK